MFFYNIVKLMNYWKNIVKILSILRLKGQTTYYLLQANVHFWLLIAPSFEIMGKNNKSRFFFPI